nr:MAG TPA: hypothetical protein [Caudoviricetes sp.]
MTSVKKIEDLQEGLTLIYLKNDSIVTISKIEDDRIFLEGRENSISLGTIKRWYKIVEENKVEETNVVEETNIEETNIEEPKVEETKIVEENKIVEETNVVEEKKDPETTENIFRLNLLKLSKELGYTERVAKRYNSFYIDKVNMFEIMGGKKVFKVYFNTKFLDSELLKRLDFVNKNVRGNQGQITVQTEEDFIRCEQLIKGVKEGF